MKSRGLVWLLVCVLIASTFAGCNGKSSGNGKNGSSNKSYDLKGRTVTIGHWGNIAPNESSPTYSEELELVEDIEKRYNCKLDFYTTNDWHTYSQQILISALSGEKISDCFYYSFESVPMWVKSGLLAPLDDYFDLEDEAWNANVSNKWRIDGKMYAITEWPDALGHVILFNKRICAEAGITDTMLYDLQDKGEWTWDKLYELAQKCTRVENGETVSYGFGAYGPAPVAVEPFVYSNGATPVKMDDAMFPQFNLDDPAVIEAMDFGMKLAYDSKACYTGSTEWGFWEGMWKNGKIGFYSVASWNIGSSHEDLLDDEFGILYTPKGPRADDYVNVQSCPSGIMMQPMVEDKDAIAAIATDFFRPYDWKTNKEHYQLYIDTVFDDESLETIKGIKGRTVDGVGGACTWFRDNVLWSDWGILSKTPARTFVEQMKAPAEAAFTDLENNPIEMPVVSEEQTSSQ